MSSTSWQDLKGVYNAKKHPEVIEGKKTEDQVLTEFLSGMEGVCGNRDGTVTKKEWIDYYTDVSASIATDAYFVAMMEVGTSFGDSCVNAPLYPEQAHRWTTLVSLASW